MAELALDIRTEGRVTYWTLNRPHRRNAIDRRLFDDLLAAADASDARNAAGVIVLQGAGTAFCAGSDVRELASLSPADLFEAEQKWSALGRRLRALHVPLIAKIRGPAMGGGLMLAAYADVRVASQTATFGAPEVRLGWIPPGGIEQLIEAAGEQVARELVLFGWTITAARAYERGIVDYLCDDDELDSVTDVIAEYTASLPRTAVRESKEYFARRGELAPVAREEMLADCFAECIGERPAGETFERASNGSVGEGRSRLLMPAGPLVAGEILKSSR